MLRSHKQKLQNRSTPTDQQIVKCFTCAVYRAAHLKSYGSLLLLDKKRGETHLVSVENSVKFVRGLEQLGPEGGGDELSPLTHIQDHGGHRLPVRDARVVHAESTSHRNQQGSLVAVCGPLSGVYKHFRDFLLLKNFDFPYRIITLLFISSFLALLLLLLCSPLKVITSPRNLCRNSIAKRLCFESLK